MVQHKILHSTERKRRTMDVEGKEGRSLWVSEKCTFQIEGK
jgi:hypothetical protein